MNLFVTSQSPHLCAQWLDDQRLIKQILECAQGLSTALRNAGISHERFYLPVHSHHPVTKWIGESKANALWTARFMHECCIEYTRRFGRKHASLDLAFVAFTALEGLPSKPFTGFYNNAKSKKLQLDFTMFQVHEAYRRYLSAKWERNTPRFTGTAPPSWFSPDQLLLPGVL